MRDFLLEWNLDFAWDNRELFLEYIAIKEWASDKAKDKEWDWTDISELNWFVKWILEMVGIRWWDTLEKTKFTMKNFIWWDINKEESNNNKLWLIWNEFYKVWLIWYAWIINDKTKIRTWHKRPF
jgi:hypothetical protein